LSFLWEIRSLARVWGPGFLAHLRSRAAADKVDEAVEDALAVDP
jgi:hypothetical protein